MSFGISAAGWAAIIAATGTSYAVYSGERADGLQKKAQNEARLNAQKQADASDQANNRANQKRPDTMALLSSAMQAGKAGDSGTLLTGPMGAAPGLTQLGKNTLLGG